MELSAGARLGRYEIVAELGSGAMGRVYQARDSRLGRDVAIKVLLADLASDPERLRRFENEARAASALNHPNILVVHDFAREQSTTYLVTELLTGESLRQRLRRGPIAIRRAIELATGVARGLAAAHDKGIVHRDLKPENLFLPADGAIKILDFGLARIDYPELSAARLDSAATLTETVAGAVLGTVGYMAPEQARGERVDARSDLFSLGVVLYEMIAGVNPFRRATNFESLHAILKEEAADLSAQGIESAPALHRIVARLLAKAPDRRFRSAHDLAFALAEIAFPEAGGSSQPTARARSPVGSSRRWLWPATLLGALALGASLALVFAPAAPVSAPPIRFEIRLPDGMSLPSNPERHSFALDPTGRTLAYVAEGGGERFIQLRDLASVPPRTVEGTADASSLFWSPDGRALAFFSGGKLKRVDAQGGPVQIICDVQGLTTGSWGSRGTILFSQSFGPNDGLFSVAAVGGVPQATSFVGEMSHWVEFLPDGRRFLYWARSKQSLVGGVFIGDLETGRSRPVLTESSLARYAAPGWLLYVHANALVAQRFDADRGELEGDPVPIASDLSYFFNGWATFSVAGERALAYQRRPVSPPLVWLDRHGRELGRVGPPGDYLAVRLSPDGASAVATITDRLTAFTDVWVIDLARGGSTRLSDEPFLEWSPVWSPSGAEIAYTATSPGPRFTITVRRVASGETVATLPSHDSLQWARGWRRNGLFVDRNEERTSWDLWRWPALDSEPTPVITTEFAEQLGSPSPDGEWLAFFSRESGQGEIELLRPAAPGRRIRVSRGARSVVPRWRGDGRELFYVSAQGWLTAIPLDGGNAPTLGEPVALFPLDLANEDGFDVAADGQRFLVSATRSTSSLPVTVELGWQAQLRRP